MIGSCGLWNSKIETIKHIFINCKETIVLWQKLQKWIVEVIGTIFNPTKFEILLGYTLRESSNLAINSMLLITKYYTFQCSSQRIKLNILTL